MASFFLEAVGRHREGAQDSERNAFYLRLVHRKGGDSELLKSHNSPFKAIELRASPDHRAELLRQWIAEQVGLEEFTLAPASADASFRRDLRRECPALL